MVIKKYLKVISNNIQVTLTYKFAYFMGLLVILIPFFIKNYLWKITYNSSNLNNIVGYNFNEIIAYNIFAMVFGQFLRTYIQYNIANEIKSGELNKYLIKPINHFVYWFSNLIGEKIICFIYISIFMSLIILSYGTFVIENITVISIFMTIIVLILAIILNFLIYYIISLLSFWFIEIASFFTAVDLIISFMSGEILPLKVLPNWLSNIFTSLPFSYSVYFPVEVLINKIKYKEILEILKMEIIWIIILSILAKYIWKLGVKRYEAIGG